jgi:hypothetical protein
VTAQQNELAEKHGTPEQFEKAIWKACDDLAITTQEAVAEINGYKYEWMQAGTEVSTSNSLLDGNDPSNSGAS